MKVIIADDEKWVRAAIINSIPFERLGLSLVCEASNGLEALDMCKKHTPDILLTDIMMPGLSGLELIEQLNKLLPKIKIVIISGFSDFSYAKTAIKYGVSDYVLKPIEEEELTELLLKIKNSILDERKKSQEEERIKSSFQKHILSEKQEEFLNQIIIRNSLTADTIKNKFESYKIGINYSNYTILVLSAENSSVFSSVSSVSHFKAIVMWIMKRYLGGITFTKYGSPFELVIFINHCKLELFTELSKCVRSGEQNLIIQSAGLSADKALAFKALSLSLLFYKKKFDGSLSIGISSAAQQLNKLPVLHEQACKSLLYGFWEPNKRIFNFDQNLINSSLDLSIPKDTLIEILFEIKLSNCTRAFIFIDKTYEYLMEGKRTNPDKVKEFFWNFIQTLINRLELNQSFSDYGLSGTNGKGPYETIKGISTLDCLVLYVKAVVRRIQKHYENINPIDNSDIIKAAKKIIEENYESDISLDNIANILHLSPTYFSAYFKRETGLSFIDYKTIIRIEKAKKFLTETNLSSVEICSRVGYNDPKYFSKLFKKTAGMTLSDFRNSTKKT